ncbi:hypothetical protein HDV01_007613 [Terramyces sp. JEL0728]|nr:hypothetical protein HDV01_007613 [Terramyces sp. JEL0728]
MVELKKEKGKKPLDPEKADVLPEKEQGKTRIRDKGKAPAEITEESDDESFVEDDDDSEEFTSEEEEEEIIEDEIAGLFEEAEEFGDKSDYQVGLRSGTNKQKRPLEQPKVGSSSGISKKAKPEK